MKLNRIPALLASLCLVACSTMRSDSVADIPSGTGSRTGEFAALDRFVGTWKGTATVTKASGPYSGVMPQTSGGALPSWDSQQKSGWVLDGNYLRTTGWHERPDAGRSEFVQYVTWDPEQQKYHAFYFSDTGETGEGWIQGDGMNSFKESWEGMHSGQSWSADGTITFIDGDTMEWSWTQKSGDGTMELRGTSKRQ